MKNFTKSVLISLAISCLAPPIFATNTYSTHNEPSSLIIKLKESTKLNTASAKVQLKQILNQAQLKMIKEQRIMPGMYAVNLKQTIQYQGQRLTPKSETLLNQNIQRIQALAEVEYAVINKKMFAIEAETKHEVKCDRIRLNDQWDILDGTAGVNAKNAWATTKGQGITVAVVDSGVSINDYLTHNLLEDEGYNVIDNSRDTNDDLGTHHGTHVAGTIAAYSPDHQNGLHGVAPESKILPVRVLNDKGSGDTAGVLKGVAWAAGLLNDDPNSDAPKNEHIAKVINLSLGGWRHCNQAEADVYQKVAEAGSTVIVATGNEEDDLYQHSPASCPSVISVTSLNSQGHRAYYSNYQSNVSQAKMPIAAPGGETLEDNKYGIISTVAKVGKTNVCAYFQGTSMAAPHAAGVAALVYAAHSNITPKDVQIALKSGVRPFPGDGPIQTNCKNDTFNCGTGIVDATKAI